MHHRYYSHVYLNYNSMQNIENKSQCKVLVYSIFFMEQNNYFNLKQKKFHILLLLHVYCYVMKQGHFFFWIR